MTIVSYVLAESANLEMVTRLNLMLKLDPDFVKNITDTRYPVNQAYQSEESFVYLVESDGKCHAGLLGVLNSLIEMNDCFRIAGVYDTNNHLVEFNLIKLDCKNDGL